MVKKRNIYRRICDAADLPDEPLPNEPLMEIIGCDRVLIENHKGVLRYSNDCIQICTRFGQILVTGARLELTRMTKGQLIISGHLQEIRIVRGNG